MDQESNIDILKEKLRSLGAEEHELDTIIDDVNSVVIQKALEEYFAGINDPELTNILETSQDPQILVEYVEAHKASFPTFTEESFKKIATDVWADYLTYVEKD